MTRGLDSDIFLFPWLSRSFFLPLPHASLPPSARPSSFPSLPTPGRQNHSGKAEVEAAARKMVQPSPLPQGWGWQLTPSWEGWRPLRGGGGNRGRGGPRAAVPPYLLVQLWGRLRATCSLHAQEAHGRAFLEMEGLAPREPGI